ncbi:methylated-DNA--[protein]-cysteine S-methyltransferase [Chloroflexota bacterium]
MIKKEARSGGEATSLAEELRYITFNTSAGWIGILASTKGLLSATLPRRSAQEAYQLLGNSVKSAARSPDLFEQLIACFRAYFNGYKVTFTDKLDVSKATGFQREVWKITSLIPYGETRSYLWVAEQIKRPKAMRAVGQALARNPLPVIIPCHRVLSINGKLGGYSGGIETKRYLLHLEVSGNTG